jgi:hypothetical protein
MAWRPPGLARLIGEAAGLALTPALGVAVADALSAVGAARLRRRARLVAFALHAVLLMGALAAAAAGGELAAQAAHALALVQLVLFVLGDLLGLRPAVRANLLALVIVAGLAGGVPAAAATFGALLVLPFLFALDRVIAGLAILPPRPPVQDRAVARAACQDAARMAAPTVLLFAIFIVVAPPPLRDPAMRAAAQDGSGRASPVPVEAYRWLVLMGLFGGGVVMGLARLLRGRGDSAPPLVDSPETLVAADEDLEPERPDESRYGPGRGRIILAYVRFLSRARALGHDLGGGLTACEIEGRLAGPQPPLGLLSRAFMVAR